ncbi:MAG: ATP-dependent helicase [Candidatus Thorarchaeota archaeon]
MMLTRQQRAAVAHTQGSSLVVACPGSGKTRTLIAKLSTCLEQVSGTAKRVACITYTNSAVYEIDSRLKSLGRNSDESQCDISTIHSFCLNNILQIFGWRLEEYPDGFTVVPPDSEKYREVVDSVIEKLGLNSAARDSISLLMRRPDGTPVPQPGLPTKAAILFWEKLASESLMDFPSILYYSNKLLREHQLVVRAIAAKYAWILVDEFQDTSEVQLTLLKQIADEHRTKFFLVGDPYQSIYGFAGAQPSQIEEFATHVSARSNFLLTENFRCSNKIIDYAERLCPRKSRMTAAGPTANEIREPQWLHVDTTADGLLEHFLPVVQEMEISYGETAVLAPWWVTLLHLGRKLRESGVPVIGPGARPYKRSHLLARFAEQLCQYVEQPDPMLIPRIERELFFLVNNATGKPNFRIFSYKGRQSIYESIRIATTVRSETRNGVEWLERTADTFAEIFIKYEFLPTEFSNILAESASDMKADMISRDVDIDSLTIADLGMFAASNKSLNLMTMHGAKGHEFDAVAVIDLHDGKVPHYSIGDDKEGLEEAKRLLYVSITRARKLLMFFTSNEDTKRPHSRFLGSEGLGYKKP